MAHGRDADGHGRMAWAGVSGMRMRGWPMGMGGMGMGGMGGGAMGMGAMGMGANGGMGGQLTGDGVQQQNPQTPSTIIPKPPPENSGGNL